MNKPQLRLAIGNLDAPAKVWRPIHYLGSKLRLVERLRLAIDAVDSAGGPVVDLFAGSGTVSAALAGDRTVIAVDIQEYSRVLCSAVLKPTRLADSDLALFTRMLAEQTAMHVDLAGPLIDYEESCLSAAQQGHPEGICELVEHSSLAVVQAEDIGSGLSSAKNQVRNAIATAASGNLILRFYGGLFFSYRQAAELDAILATVRSFPIEKRDALLAASISTASEVVNTVGKHFAQPIRLRGADGAPKRHLISKVLKDRRANVPSFFNEWLERYQSLESTGRPHQALRGDYAETLSRMNDIAVVYADPPYTRDHYSRFYHVLETMCLGDDPGVSTTRIRSKTATHSRGMYRADRHQSPFCIKSQAPSAFERLFATVRDRNVPLVLSYSPYTGHDSHPRVMSVDDLRTIAAKYFAHVEMESVGAFRHMKLNAAHRHLEASSEAELIFLCR